MRKGSLVIVMTMAWGLCWVVGHRDHTLQAGEAGIGAEETGVPIAPTPPAAPPVEAPDAPALPDAPDAPDVPDVPDAPDVPATDGDPYDAAGMTSQGKVNAARVNVRAGPGTRYEIVVTVSKDTPVTVHAKVGDWLKIAYPAGQHCYIHPRHLQGDIELDRLGDGQKLGVQSETAPLRVRNWDRSSVVGQVKRGDLVTIIGMRGRWAKITPPATAFAWIFHRYVTYQGEVKSVEAPVASDTDGAVTTTSLPKTEKEEKQEKEMRQQRAKSYEVLVQRQQEYENRQQERVSSVMQDIQAKLDAIDRSVAEKKGQVSSPAPVQTPIAAEKDYGYTGWVEYIGHVGRRPAAFRLMKGGEILFLLRSAKFDLGKFTNRRIKCFGLIEEAPGFKANVLIVEGMELLDVGPETVREQPDIRRPYVPLPARTRTPRAEPVDTPPAVDQEDAGATEGDEGLDTDTGDREVAIPPVPTAGETTAPPEDGAVTREVQGESPPPLPDVIGGPPAGENDAEEGSPESKTEVVVDDSDLPTE